MKYITHHRFKKKALCGKILNIPYGTELECRNNILYTPDNRMICYDTSENAKIHFAANDDGKGLERGKYTYEIAYGRKYVQKKGFRFSDKQRDIIGRHFQRFLRTDCDMIIFNEKFFRASIEDLKQMADELHIRV